jgi:flavin-binding protein dodecin
MRFARRYCILAAEGMPRGELTMTMLKVVEILAQSDKSWEDAAQKAVSEASKTLRGIKSIYIKDMEATVENGKLDQYRINGKVSFLIDGS